MAVDPIKARDELNITTEMSSNDTIRDKIETEAIEKKPISSLSYWLIIFFAIGIKILQPITISMAKSADQSIRFNETTMVLLIELFKLAFCLLFFLFHYCTSTPENKKDLISLNFKESLHFLVPALLYGASNTLVYYGMSFISPAFFHVFGNIRILTAGILYRLIMGKKQTDVQWLAMTIIAIGAMLSSGSDSSVISRNMYIGFFLILAMTFFSTSASIYTEKYFKKTQEASIFFQNCVLYSYGLAVNGVVLATRSNAMGGKGAFEGFDVYALYVLVVQSVMGVSLSFIFKFLDNIVYVISLIVAMFLTAIVTSFIEEFTITFTYICCLLLVTIGIYFFYRDKIFQRFHIHPDLAYF